MKFLISDNIVLIIQSHIGLVFSRKFLSTNSFKVTSDIDKLKNNKNKKIIFFVRNPYARLVFYFSELYPRKKGCVNTFIKFMTNCIKETPEFLKTQLNNLRTIESIIKKEVDEIFYCEKNGKNYINLSASLGFNVDESDFYLKTNTKHFTKYYEKDIENNWYIEKFLEEDCNFFGYSFDKPIISNFNYLRKKMIKNAKFIFDKNSNEITEKLQKDIVKIKDEKKIESVKISEYKNIKNILDSHLKYNSYISEKNKQREMLFDYYLTGSLTKIPNTKFISLDKVFFIVLDPDEQIEKINNLKKIFGDKLEILTAVDSRGDKKFIYKEYGLDLFPISYEFEMNFSTSFGAVGCYLSHYEIYMKVLQKNYDFVLILEEDISLENMKMFSSDIIIPDNTDFIQLNSRVVDTENYEYFFCENTVDGTESYIISKNGASKMIDATHSIENSNLEYYTNFLIWIAHDQETSMYDTDLLYSTYKESISSINSIRAPIDKFLHFVCSNFMDREKQMTSFALPLLNLDETRDQSTVITEIPHWERDVYEIVNFRKYCQNFKWWEKK